MEILDNIKIKIIGSSHEGEIGFELTGIERGNLIDFNLIDNLLIQRKGHIKYNTTRIELEDYHLLSGFEDNTTNGEIIKVIIKQKNFNSNHYEYGVIRPGHADLSAYLKYKENYKYAGGGQFSGRMTVLYVIIGEIIRQIITKKEDIKIYSNLKQVFDIFDDDLALATEDQLAKLKLSKLPVLNLEKKKLIEQLLVTSKKNKTSVGAVVKTIIYDHPAGLGDDFFNSFESKLSALIFSIPAVKGIDFGLGFGFVEVLGHQVIEENLVEGGKLKSNTNYNGGINGGITNGIQPIVFSTVIKPTSSIFKQMNTVKYTGNGFENHQLNLNGRHDTFIANRAIYAIEAMAYICLYDLVINKENDA